MSQPDDSAIPIDPQRLQEVLRIVHEQVAAALWLSAGMLMAVGAIACIAFGWRRTALAFGFLYCASLCFVHNGHAQVLGPVGCALASIGFLWPQGRVSRHDPPAAR